MLVTVPVLESQRLRLRAHRRDDLDACVAMWADPQVTRHIGGRPFSRQETWSKILRYAGLWPLLGYGYWLVEEKASGEFVGELGFAEFMRELVPSIAGVPELGWALTPKMHGKGYATEALQAAIAWGDEHLGRERTVCIIDPDNLPSLRVAEKCGYGEPQRTVYAATPTLLLTRWRPKRTG